MKTPTEIIRDIEQFYDVETLELQIRYCKTVMYAAIEETELRRERLKAPDTAPDAPKTPTLRPLPLGPVNQCKKTLSLLSEARRYQRLLITQAVNTALGADSPYLNDGFLRLHQAEDIYARYCNLRLGITPRAAKPRKESALEYIHREYISKPNQPPFQQSRGERFGSKGSGSFLGGPQGSGSFLGGPQGSGSFLGGSMPKKVPDPLTQDLTEDHDPLPEAEEALANELAEWSLKATEWLNNGNFNAPLPELSYELVSKLHADRDTNPQAAQCLEVIARLIGKAEAARLERMSQPGQGDHQPQTPA